ncbi:hypothetical protein N6H18_11050 [Reichenbachiella agarivorans]|uniref:Beta-barrel porin-2, OmpL-like. bbp2 n=1 Tax=Reichenbachiella agarivorans TaxID=2979464 RepID=A0ABY6CKG8_9BACT|nr:hypothetical protein [Reichenbachiella agarivorans]UXP30889.1 hypothetical protein N6H18_11050 [Reichenbachiella agarivorans]
MGLTFCCVWQPEISRAQEIKSDSTLTVLFAELDDLFAEGDDTEDLIALVDSMLVADKLKISSLHARIGYISQVTNAGRSLDINQFGVSPGVTYYHHTGVFADVSGFVNSEYDPSYYMTDASIGYLYTFKNVLTSSVSHDFYFYNDTLDTHSFNKSLQVSTYLDYKALNLGVDYAYLYGSNSAHRLTGRVGFDLRAKDVWFLDQISIHPSFSVQWGNSEVVYLRQTEQPFRDLYNIMVAGDYPVLSWEEVYRFGRLLKNERGIWATKFLLDRGYTADDINEIIIQYNEDQIHQDNEYGIMNYAVSIPVIFSINRHWTLITSYTYNMPVSLPNETYQLENNGFLSLSLAYKFLFVQ